MNFHLVKQKKIQRRHVWDILLLAVLDFSDYAGVLSTLDSHTDTAAIPE